jgi:hypothetical protein
MSPTALKAFIAPSQIGGNGEVRGIYFTFLNDLRYPSVPERLLPRRSLKQLPTLTEVE